MEVPLNSIFVDPGATANGACAGTNVTMQTNDPVNVNVLGTYIITYIGTDLSGNSATNTRTVDVIPDVVNITSPTNGNSFSAPANVSVSADANLANGIQTMVLYTNGVPAATNLATTNFNTVLNGLSSGSYQVTVVASYTGFSVTSAVVNVTVNVPGTALINFDPLANFGPIVGNPILSQYLAQYGVTLTNNSPGTTVVAENQAVVAGGGFATASSQPNLLTQIGSIGPVSFTAGFSNLLSQFSFTRPALIANPYVTHPAWQVEAFDPLGQLLAVINVPQIFSTTNVPAQTYTLTNPVNGAGIASIEFNSQGTGLTTFNAMLLDDFLLTVGSNLPPSILITSPTNGQVFTTATDIPINAATAPGSGIVD